MTGGESPAASFDGARGGPPRDASERSAGFSLELVVAVAANGVIGRGGTLPWHLPDDLKHFKALTMGHAILMGRRTYESIGKPLPGRHSIVVSTTMTEPPAAGVDLARSLDEAVAIAKHKSPGPAFVIGGAALYDAAMAQADVLHVTELDDTVEGDTFLRAIDKSQWRMVNEQRHERDERHAYAFWFRMYQRAHAAS